MLASKALRRRLLAAGLCAGGLGLAVGSPAHALSLSLFTGTPMILVGESVDVDVVISDLTAPGLPALRSFDLDLTFDSALLDFLSVDFGLKLGYPALFEAFVDSGEAGGVIDLAEVSILTTATLDALQTSPFFVLATLHFEGLALGTATLSLTETLLGDENGDALVTGGVPMLDVEVVPEPASASLLLLGMVALGAGLARRPR